MSLVKRVLIAVQIVLALAGIIGALGFHATVRHMLEAKQDNLLDARLSWLETSVELDFENDEVELEPRKEPDHCAPFWLVTTSNGKILWASKAKVPQNHFLRKIKNVSFGLNDGRAPLDSKLIERVIGENEDAADARKTKLGILYPRFGLPEDISRVNLVFTTWVSTEAMQEELKSLSKTLLTAVPVGLILMGILLTLLVRWQLRPLERMAEESSNIGPNSTGKRIETPVAAKECVVLRDSLNAMIERLEKGIERERQFASVAAHELRTPVAQLRTNIEVTLRRERSIQEHKKVLIDASIDIKRLQNLLAGLLKLTRAGSDQWAEDDQTLVSALVDRLHKAYPSVSRDLNGVTNGLTLHANEEMAFAAISNVVKNALCYAPSHPPAMGFTESPTFVEIAIADHGPGIPEQDRERIFQPLFRLDKARTINEATEGFGLGLSVARTLTQAMGGVLFCRARLNGEQGATFVFRFQKSTSHG